MFQPLKAKKLCHKHFHLLETSSSRADASSEHVLTRKPNVLTSRSNVGHTKLPFPSSIPQFPCSDNIFFTPQLSSTLTAACLEYDSCIFYAQSPFDRALSRDDDVRRWRKEEDN